MTYLIVKLSKKKDEENRNSCVHFGIIDDDIKDLCTIYI
jgi:hypothetical protein